jgi:hypothetical protein
MGGDSVKYTAIAEMQFAEGVHRQKAHIATILTTEDYSQNQCLSSLRAT